MSGPELVPARGAQEKLIAAIEIVIKEGISKEPGAARFLAERVIAVMADFARSQVLNPTIEGTDPETLGQINMKVSSDEKLVQINFGMPIAWCAMPKPQALTFAFSILEHCGVVISHKIQQNPAPGEPS